MVAAIYARKSTEQNGVADEARSVIRQIEHAKLYATKKGWTVAEEHVYVDDGISGAEFVKRAGFLRLINALKPRPPFQVLIMSEESRLGREAIQVGYAFKQIIDAGVRIFFYLVDQERKLESATDKMLLALTNFAAEFEREKASQRTHDAMLRKANALYVTGNKVYGYDNVPVYGADLNPDGTAKRQHVVRQINPVQAKTVVQIFELYASGIGLAQIAKTLNAEQVVPPHGGRLGWCPTAIRDILRRDLYRGIVWWNRTQSVHREGTKKQRKRPESDWLRKEALELRIVSESLWERVAARHNQNLKTYARGPHGRLLSRPTGEDLRSSYLLSSIAKCALCSGSIVAISRGRNGRSGATLYRCSYNYKRGPNVCRNHVAIRQDVFDSAVLNSMDKALDAKVLEASVYTALARLRKQQSRLPDQRAALQQELSSIEKRLHHLVELVADGQGTNSVIEALHREEQRKRTIVQQLGHLDAISETVSLDEKRLTRQLLGKLGNLPALFGRHVTMARQMLRKLLDGYITCEPIEEGGKPGYRFTATGTFDRLLTGATLVNDGGGGEGS